MLGNAINKTNGKGSREWLCRKGSPAQAESEAVRVCGWHSQPQSTKPYLVKEVNMPGQIVFSKPFLRSNRKKWDDDLKKTFDKVFSSSVLISPLPLFFFPPLFSFLSLVAVENDKEVEFL